MASEPQNILRWVCYGGAYFAGLLIAPNQVPTGVEVPEGSSFVLFLDDESGAVVPNTDIEPFSLDIPDRVNNPDAAVGVARARGIIYGPVVNEADTDELEGDAEAANMFGSLHAAAPTEDDGKAAKKAAKKAEKERKKAEKELRRAEKRQEKNKKKHLDDDDEDNDDDDDEDDELVAALGLDKEEVKKEKRTPSKHKRHRDEDEEDEAASSPGKDHDDDDHWKDFNDEYEMDDAGKDVSAGPLASGRRRVAALHGRGGSSNVNGAGGMSGALAALAARGSAVSPYLPEIRYWYQQLWDEAGATGALLSGSEYDVVRAVEQRLRTEAAKRALIEDSLANLRNSGENFMSHAGKTSSSSSAKLSEKEIHEKAEQLSTALDALSKPIEVERLVRELVVLTPVPNREALAAMRKQRNNATAAAFTDPSIAYLVKRATDVAQPRELTQDMVQTYREQRIQRERLLAARRGLGKMGLRGTAPLRVMEQWRRARELMVLSAPVETQAVLPTGFISRKYSEAVGKVRNSAVRRLKDILQTSGADLSQGNGTHGFSGGSFMGTQDSFTSSAADLLSSYQQNGGAAGAGGRSSRQAIPVYYNFNSLRGPATGRTASSSTFPTAGGVTNLSAAMMLHNGTGGGGGGAVAGTQGMLPSPSGILMSPLGGEDPMMLMSMISPAMLGVGSELVDGGATQQQQQHDGGMHLITPLNIPAEQREAFVLRPEELARELQAANNSRLGLRSEQYSASIRLPSQESHWYSEAYSHAGGGDNGGGRERSNSRAGSTSRASSVASSTAHSETSRRRHRKRDDDSSAAVEGGAAAAAVHADWRKAAKTAILEQLTLYYRGLRGRPAVLSKDDFKNVAQKLLERAVQAEAARTGRSMVLQVNNSAVTFTKEVEAALKRSVDSYVYRRFIAPPSQEANSAAVGAAAARSAAVAAAKLHRTDEEEAYQRAQAAARHEDVEPTVLQSMDVGGVVGEDGVAADSPVYETFQ